MATATAAPASYAGVLATLETLPTFTVVQIGAFVGSTDNDPLHGFLTRVLPARAAEAAPIPTAVLVEPVGEYFALLREAYAGVPGVRFEQAAIAERAGLRDFFRLGADPVAHGLPAWLSQLGSLRPDRMTALWDHYERGHRPDSARLTDFYEAHKVVEPVTCLTFEMLLQRHGVTHVDLLQIDAEGYDYDILRSINFSRTRPTFVNYERVLLGSNEQDCRELMTAAGYTLTDWGQDTLCTSAA